jgi:hypothetical protein
MSALRNNPAGHATLPHGTLPPCLTAILSAPNLKTNEKRSILSSWASDLHAVESKPWLRRVPGLHTTIVLNDILRALQSLDSDDDDPPKGGGAAMRLASLARSEPRSGCSDKNLPSEVTFAAKENTSGSIFGTALNARRGRTSEQTPYAKAREARIAAHQKNLTRYRRILSTSLTEIERAYIHRRIEEERKALLSLDQTG